jgi:hypothetical protein
MQESQAPLKPKVPTSQLSKRASEPPSSLCDSIAAEQLQKVNDPTFLRVVSVTNFLSALHE